MATTKKQTPNQAERTAGGFSPAQTDRVEPNAGRGPSPASNIDGRSSAASTFSSSQDESKGGSADGKRRDSSGMTTGSGPDRSASGGTAAGTATARSFYDQAKESAGQAYEAAADKASTKLDEQKSNLSGGLSAVADSVRKVGDNLRGPDVQDGISKFTAEYSDAAATKIENIANYFDQKSVREMYSDVENFARRNPAVFVGGAFALGLLLSRFLKSGADSQWSDQESRSRKLHSMPSGGISTASEYSSGQGVQDRWQQAGQGRIDGLDQGGNRS